MKQLLFINFALRSAQIIKVYFSNFFITLQNTGQGKLFLYLRNTALPTDTKEYLIATEQWPAGIYFYRINDGSSGKQQTGQFVVTH